MGSQLGTYESGNRHSRGRRMLGNLSGLSSSESDEEFDDTNVSAPSLFRTSRSHDTPKLEMRASESHSVGLNKSNVSRGMSSISKSTSERSLKPGSPRDRVLLTPLRRVTEKRSTPLKQPPVSRRSIEEALEKETSSVKSGEKYGLVDVEVDIIRSNKLISDDNKFSPKRSIRVAGSPFRDRTDEKSTSPRSDVKIRPIEFGKIDQIGGGKGLTKYSDLEPSNTKPPDSVNAGRLSPQSNVDTHSKETEPSVSIHQHGEQDIFVGRSSNSKLAPSKMDLATYDKSVDISLERSQVSLRSTKSPRSPIVDSNDLPEQNRREILSQIDATIESFKERETSRRPTHLMQGSSESSSSAGENILLPIEPEYGENDGFTRVNSDILQESHDILKELDSYIEPPPPIEFGTQSTSRNKANLPAIENQYVVEQKLPFLETKDSFIDGKVSLSGAQRRELIKKLEKSELQKRTQIQIANLDQEASSPIKQSKPISKPVSNPISKPEETISKSPSKLLTKVEKDNRGGKRFRDTSDEDFLDALEALNGPEWLNVAWSKLNSIVNLGLLSEEDIFKDSFLQKTLRVSEAELAKRVKFLVKLNNKEREHGRRRKRRRKGGV